MLVQNKAELISINIRRPRGKRCMKPRGWLGGVNSSLRLTKVASFLAHRGRDVISNCARVINDFISPCLPET
ncbi:hypothetical protein CN090_34680 [Sinorhizobium meliloti]|nr:hypothetical protein CN234_36460 [Sinorhizobium meliloti]RVH83301.1 hypothetical protein CN199_34225 [Sinorhizobium meliloti]RVK20221.1 hypothetical protein CN156_33355 [Sinorhizobium meliloti]RVK37337.1 hypothetical protein CN160_35790 [Sinorhizobium meliloti]RVK44048.1 hypothetical protein CN155_34470 [Sinorhizobium meliloti]